MPPFHTTLNLSQMSKINLNSYSNEQHGGFDLPKKVRCTKE